MTRYEIGGCPACLASAHDVIADADQIRDEMEQLWAFHTRRLRPDTPADRLHDRVAFSQEPPLRVVCCQRCGLLYRNPRERIDELVETYRDEQPDEAALSSLFDNQCASYRVQAKRLTKIFGGTGTGLEIGSYIGAFLAAAREHNWAFTGLDVNDAANRFAQSRNLDVRSGTIDAARPDTAFDVVAFWNCFDQLPDPRAAVITARARIRDGGILALRVPNGGFYARWRSRLDSPIGFLARSLLAHNNLLAFPYRHGFTIGSLRSLLETSGFRVERVFGDALVPVADEWTRRWAGVQERLIKGGLKALPPDHAPWLEIYARAV
jgi:SAM-dependent methyltransferase